MKFIAVFCGSSNPAAPKYKEIAEEITTRLITEGFSIVYGGTGGGLMKVVADKVFELDGDIVGVVTPSHKPDTRLHKKNVIITPDLDKRKKAMLNIACGAIILPGGRGTMDELFMLMSRNDEADFYPEDKIAPMPTVIVNADGFFDGLIQQFSRCHQEKLLSPAALRCTKVTTKLDEIISHLKEYKPQSLTPWEGVIDHHIVATEILNHLDQGKTAGNYAEFLQMIAERSQRIHAEHEMDKEQIQDFILGSCRLLRPKRKDELFSGKPRLTFDPTRLAKLNHKPASLALH